jgi:hypothetical protein
MPANFGEIAGYHSRIAARHLALAQTARAYGNDGEANYQTELAARYITAAQEQKIAMTQGPGTSAANPRAKHWPMVQPPRPWLAVCVMAVAHGVGRVVNGVRQSKSGRDDSFTGLSLR